MQTYLFFWLIHFGIWSCGVRMHLKQINFRLKPMKMNEWIFSNSICDTRNRHKTIIYYTYYVIRIQNESSYIVLVVSFWCLAAYLHAIRSYQVSLAETISVNIISAEESNANKKYERWEMFPVYGVGRIRMDGNWNWTEKQLYDKKRNSNEKFWPKLFLCVLFDCVYESAHKVQIRHELFKELTCVWIRLRYDDILVKNMVCLSGLSQCYATLNSQNAKDCSNIV